MLAEPQVSVLQFNGALFVKTTTDWFSCLIVFQAAPKWTDSSQELQDACAVSLRLFIYLFLPLPKWSYNTSLSFRNLISLNST